MPPYVPSTLELVFFLFIAMLSIGSIEIGRERKKLLFIGIGAATMLSLLSSILFNIEALFLIACMLIIPMGIIFALYGRQQESMKIRLVLIAIGIVTILWTIFAIFITPFCC